jgi:PAS domain S-box-containing protein
MSYQKINILLVDDKPENLMALEAVLTSPKYNLVKAYSGEEALKLMLSTNFSLILLDVQMPGLDGFETARLIRQRKKTKNIPIIFVTAISQANEFVIKGYQIGATDYIIKPFHPDTLRLKIKGYLKVYQERENLESLVQERTAELQAANRKLLEEVKQRKIIAEKLMVSNKKVTSILASISDAFISVDNNWLLTYINKEAIQLSGLFNMSPEGLIGRSIWELVPESIAAKLYDRLNEAMHSQERVHFQLEVANAEHTFYDVNAYPFFDGLSIYFRDITETKRLEKEMTQIDRLNTVGKLAAGIAHEVRNPMTTVRGLLQVLAAKEECAKYYEYFPLMISELDRANSIITNFLSLARDKFTEFKSQNLNDIVKNLFPLLQADAMVSDKNVYMELEEVLEIPLDGEEIRQLILNLVRNGLQAMSPGGSLSIRTFMTEQEIVLSVQDDGPGIAPEVLEKIGTPFYTSKENGTGLGLSVCYSIAAKHNATIDIETSAKGTTFYVRFKKNQTCLEQKIHA